MPISVFEGNENQIPAGFDHEELELDSDFLDVAVAGFNRESDIVGDIYNMMNPMPQASPDEISAAALGTFSPFEYMGEDHPFNSVELRSQYAGLVSPAQVDWQVAKHQREVEQMRHLENSPIGSIPFELAGGLFSKATLIEGFLFGGLPATVGKRMVAAAGMSATTTGMQEWWLHNQQDMRTWQETAFGMAGGVVLSSAIAGATGRFASTMPMKQGVNEMNETTIAANTVPTNRPTEGFMGPMQPAAEIDPAAKIALREERTRPVTPIGVAVGTLGGLTKFINPDVRMATSKWITMRAFAGDALDHSVDTVAKMEGTAGVPLDVTMRQHDTWVDLNVNNIVNDGYTKYITKRTGKMADMKAAMTRNKEMSKGEFHAAIRDDITSGFERDGANHVMREAAQKLYNEVILPVGRDMVRTGHLDGDAAGNPLPPKGDKLWFPRGWNVQKAKMMSADEWADQMIEPHMKGLQRSVDAEDAAAVSQYHTYQNELHDVVRYKAEMDAEQLRLKEELETLKGRGSRVKREQAKANSQGAVENIRRRMMSTSEETAKAVEKAQAAKNKAARTRLLKKNGKLSSEQQARFDLGILGRELTNDELLRINDKFAAKRIDELEGLMNDIDARPKAKELIEAGTPEGLKKIRERYLGMHKKLIDGSDMGDRFDMNIKNKKWLSGTTGGNVQLTNSRSLDVATIDAPEGFLEDSPMMSLSYALKRQQRAMDVENDGRFGDATFKNWFDDLKQERQLKREKIADNEKLTPEKKEKELLKLEKSYNQQRDYMRKTIQALYDIRKPPEHYFLHQIGQSIKSIAVLNQLGSVITSVLPETVAPMSHVGFRGVAKHIASWALNPKMMKEMTRQQKADMLVGVQTGQAARIAEHGDYEFGMAKFTKGLHKVTDFAIDKAYFLGVWTRMASSQAGGMVQSAWGRNLLKADFDANGNITGLSKRDIEDFGRAGIRRDQLPALIKNVKQHATKVNGGGVVLNLKDKHNDWIWDQEAGEVMQRALFGAVNNIIIKPGTASVPFISRTMAGSVSMQFKNFMMASTSKYFLHDMQKIFRGDMRGMERQLAFYSTGIMVTALKTSLYGKDLDDIEDRQFYMDALANGGGAGVGAEVLSFMQETLMGGSTRYMGNRTPLGMIIGPAPQMANDMILAPMKIIKGIKDGELTRSDFESVARGIPGNNYAPFRFLGLRDAAIDLGNETFGTGE